MDIEIQRRMRLCEQTQDTTWEDIIAVAGDLREAEKKFLKDHPPGLVKALWHHFEATRDKCGCKSPSHEIADCPAGLIEQLLLDEESL